MIRFLMAMLFLPIVLFCQTQENEQKKYHELKLEIVKILQKTKVVGVSVAIVNNYEVAWAMGFGLAEVGTNDSIITETLFQAPR